MKNKNKVIILASIIVGVLVVTLGLTYAVISFNETKGNSQLVLGDIYMHYSETNQINLQNAIPTESYLPNGYFEFTIDGKNTYTKKDIWYEIVLNHGDDHETRTERIRDDLLKFRLVEVVDEEEVELFTNKSYSSLKNQRIWVDTISKNTTSEINKTYRLYMWISSDTKVGNTSDVDYDNETWNEDVYGSIKVNVTGNFEEKNLTVEVADASCFDYYYFNYQNPTVNPIMATQEVQELNELTKCISRFNGYSFDEGSNAESFCKGTGSVEEMTFQNQIDDMWFIDDELQEMASSNILVYDGEKYVVNSIMETQTLQELNEITSCVLSFTMGYEFDEGSTAESFCRGTGTTDGSTFQTVIDADIESFSHLIYDNVILITSAEVDLISYNTSCGLDVVIPNTIDGYSVTKIDQYAFSENQLRSVVIPNSVTEIGQYAFSNNQLKSIEIPNSVVMIQNGAFSNNQLQTLTFAENSNLEQIGSRSFADNLLTTLKIPNSVTTIGNEGDEGWYFDSNTFANNKLISVEIGNGIQRMDNNVFAGNENLVSLTINRTCSNIKNIVGVAVYSGNRVEEYKYPWGANNAGTTIYGTNGEVCDTF